MFLHFETLWPWPLTFWHKNHVTCGISQDHSLYQVWRVWDHSFLSYAADTHTHTETDANERFSPRLSSTWVINDNLISMYTVTIFVVNMVKQLSVACWRDPILEHRLSVSQKPYNEWAFERTCNLSEAVNGNSAKNRTTAAPITTAMKIATVTVNGKNMREEQSAILLTSDSFNFLTR